MSPPSVRAAGVGGNGTREVGAYFDEDLVLALYQLSVGSKEVPKLGEVDALVHHDGLC